MNLLLEEENARFKFIADNAAEPFILVNQDGSFEYLNKEVLDKWGYTAEEAKLLRMPDVDPLFSLERFQTLFLQCQHEEIPLFESLHKRKDGSTYPVEIKVGGMKLGKSTYLFALARDISSRRLAEAALQESEKRFRNTVNQAPTAIIILRGNNFIVEVANEAYLKVVDRHEMDLVGKPLFVAMPEAEQAVRSLLEDVLKTGSPFHGVEYPVPIKRFGAMEISYFDFLYHPLKEEDQSISGIIVTATDVTLNVKAKHAISESEKQFRKMVMDSPIAMAIFREPDMIIEMANTTMLEQIWRRPKEDVINKKLIDAFPELVSQSYPATLKKVFESGIKHSEKESAVIVKTPNGTRTIYIDYEYTPLMGTDGRSSGIMVTIHDVTEKMEAHKKIEESEIFNRTVLESSPDCVKVLDLAGKISFINVNGICVLEGEKKEDFLNREWNTLWTSENQSVVNNSVTQAIKGRANKFIALSPTMKGTMKWWNVSVTPILDSDGGVMSVLATSRDVTAEKKREEDLMESELKFRLLADSMPQFVWTSDAEGSLNYFNQSVYQYTGLSEANIRDNGWLQIVHPSDIEKNIQKWTESVSTGKDFLLEHRFKRFDGIYRWQLSRAIPRKDSSGNILMWVGTSTDIEDQKTFATELEQKVEDRTRELAHNNLELAKMNKELESFAYISSHDLQEPLRKIQTFANQILDKEAALLTPAGKDKFQRMQNAAKRMQTLIEDILNYSRTSNAKRVFKSSDLNLVLAEVKEDLKDELSQKNAIIESGQLCHANIITFQFRQLLYNLIRNALKFSAPGVRPLIKIESRFEQGKNLPHANLHTEQQYCHISVADNGIGFEQEYSEKIFEVFQRLHGRNEYEGTGIGLAIVKKIVENHNGIISAKGLPGEGARFDIFLPVPEDTNTPTASPNLQPS